MHVQQLLSEVPKTSGAEWVKLILSIAVPERTMVLFDTRHDVFSAGCAGMIYQESLGRTVTLGAHPCLQHLGWGGYC